MTPVEIDPLYVPPPAEEPWVGFATVADVEARLGRDLADAESDLAEYVIGVITGLIVDLAGEDLAWAEALVPVPAYYKMLCVEKAVSVIANPSQLEVDSETLGAYQYSKRFRDSNLFLTAEELRGVGQILGFGGSGSVRVPSLLHDVYVTEA